MQGAYHLVLRRPRQIIFCRSVAIAMERTSQLAAGLSRNRFGVRTGKRNLACGLGKKIACCRHVRRAEPGIEPDPSDLALAVMTNGVLLEIHDENKHAIIVQI